MRYVFLIGYYHTMIWSHGFFYHWNIYLHFYFYMEYFTTTQINPTPSGANIAGTPFCHFIVINASCNIYNHNYITSKYSSLFWMKSEMKRWVSILFELILCLSVEVVNWFIMIKQILNYNQTLAALQQWVEACGQ